MPHNVGFLDYSTSHTLRSTWAKKEEKIWAASWQNQQNDMCAQQRLRSAWASTWRNLGSLATHWVQSKDWLDWVDVQADLSLRWAHRWFCWFCLEVAHIQVNKQNWWEFSHEWLWQGIIYCISEVSFAVTCHFDIILRQAFWLQHWHSQICFSKPCDTEQLPLQ